MRDPILIAKEIESTRETLRRPSRGRPVYRFTPGCTRGCKRCDIRCAVLMGELADLELELEAAQGAAKIIRFPMSVSTAFQQRLSRCLSMRAYDLWMRDLRRAQNKLDDNAYLDLVRRATAKRLELIAEGR